MSRKLSAMLVTVSIMLTGVACRTPKAAKVISKDERIELGEAESTQVSIVTGVGKLNISGGAACLLDARFEYDNPDWTPQVSYNVENGLGRLAVKQPDSDIDVKTRIQYDWGLKFRNRVPKGLAIQMRDVDVRYDWVIGLTDKVPTDLIVEMGIGKIDIDTRRVNLRRLKVTCGVGEGRIDLSHVNTDLAAEIDAGFGNLTLLLPPDVGVKVKADGIGLLEAPGLTKKDGVWTNAGWGKSKVSISIDVAGIGTVEIETVARHTCLPGRTRDSFVDAGAARHADRGRTHETNAQPFGRLWTGPAQAEVALCRSPH
jgi:hypothetical protein